MKISRSALLRACLFAPIPIVSFAQTEPVIFEAEDPARDARLHDDYRHATARRPTSHHAQRHESAGVRPATFAQKVGDLHRDLSRAGQLRALRALLRSARAAPTTTAGTSVRASATAPAWSAGERRARSDSHVANANGLHRRHRRLECLSDGSRSREAPGQSHGLDRARRPAHADVLLGHARRRHVHGQVRVRPPGIVVHGERSRHRRSRDGHRAAGSAAGSAGIYARRRSRWLPDTSPNSSAAPTAAEIR